MKTYIKPNTTITDIELQNHLLIISGGENTKQGGSNGDYTSGVTLGSRRSSLWDDEDDEE
ncbi:MAG: hypothetical protein J6Z14_07635 [Prevotella sp.]|nr:hypothetical protein [Prevotella sp.]